MGPGFSPVPAPAPAPYRDESQPDVEGARLRMLARHAKLSARGPGGEDEKREPRKDATDGPRPGESVVDAARRRMLARHADAWR